MKRTTLLLVPVLYVFLALQAFGQESAKPKEPTQAKPPARQPLQLADVLTWQSVRGATLSPDGQWFAYRLAAPEGDSEVILRKTHGDEEKRFPGGEAKGFFGGDVTFSDDSKWLAFRQMPPAKKEKKGPASATSGAAEQKDSKLVVIELATAARHEFEKVRRFVFSPKGTGWLALQMGGAAAPLGLPGFPRRGDDSTDTAGDRAAGSDLVLRELATSQELNIGNVSEFAFDKSGQRLAFVIDAQNQSGNGVQLRHLATSVQISLDSGKATYRGLTWTEKGDAIAVLKGSEDKAYEGKLYSVVGFTDLAGKPNKVVYDPTTDKAFPVDMTISPNRSATWTHDLKTLVFGIHTLKKKEPKSAPKAKEDKVAGGEGGFQPPRQPSPKGSAAAAGGQEKPDLVIWHWKDARLQSQQQVQASIDKSQSHLCVYHVADKRFVRLGTDTLRASLAPKDRYAVAYDNHKYELSGSLDGRRYQDVYVINVDNGSQRLALGKHRWSFVPSPAGTHAYYYDDGHYYCYDFATAATVNLTKDAPVRFVNDEDDHNIINPPAPAVGWSKDGQTVLLSDNWDVWALPINGGTRVNLTVNGKKDGLRYRRPFVLDVEEKGIDLAGTVYLSCLEEWTKKGGIVAFEGGRPGVKRVVWGDAAYDTLLKAKKHDTFIYTRETSTETPETTRPTVASLARARSPTSPRNSRATTGREDRSSWTTPAPKARSCKGRCSCPPITSRANATRPSSTFTRDCRRVCTSSRRPRRAASTARCTRATATPSSCPTSPTR